GGGDSGARAAGDRRGVVAAAPRAGPVDQHAAVLAATPEVDEDAEPEGVEVGDLRGPDHPARDPEDEPGAEPAAVLEGMPADVAHPKAVDAFSHLSNLRAAPTQPFGRGCFGARFRHSTLLSGHVYTRCHCGIG